MMTVEFNSITRQNRVRKQLNGLRLSKVMAEKRIGVSEGSTPRLILHGPRHVRPPPQAGIQVIIGGTKKKRSRSPRKRRKCFNCESDKHLLRRDCQMPRNLIKTAASFMKNEGGTTAKRILFELCVQAGEAIFFESHEDVYSAFFESEETERMSMRTKAKVMTKVQASSTSGLLCVRRNASALRMI
jgi:hypothetical protein